MSTIATNALFETAGLLNETNVENVILQTQAGGNAPIYSALVAQGRVAEIDTTEYAWYDRKLKSTRNQINNGSTAYAADTTSLVVDDGSLFRAGNLVLAEATGEVLYVSAVSTNTLTVVRGIGATTGAIASVANNAWLQVIGNASGDGSDAPAASMSAPTEHRQYLQTFRESIVHTGRALSERQVFGSSEADQRAEKLELHLRDIERSIIHGVLSKDTTDAAGNRVYTAGGLLANITTNRDNVAGTMSESRFNQFLEQAFSIQGSEVKIGFFGPTLMTTIHTLYGNKVRSADGAIRVGLPIQEVTTPFGDLRIIPHRGLTGAFAGYGIVVDPAQAGVLFKQGERGRPHLREHTVGTADKKSEEWMAETGVYWGSEAFHAVISGVTGAA